MRLRLLIPILAILLGALAVTASFYNAEHAQNRTEQKVENAAHSEASKAKDQGPAAADAKADASTQGPQAKPNRLAEAKDQTSAKPAKGAKGDKGGSEQKQDQTDQAGKAHSSETSGPQSDDGSTQTESEPGGSSPPQARHADAEPNSPPAQWKPKPGPTDPTAPRQAKPAAPGSANQRSLADLRVQPGDYTKWLAIGSDQPKGDYAMRVVFNGFGAGIQRLTLAKHRASADDSKPYALIDLPLDRITHYTPYGARTVWINGQAVGLSNDKWQSKGSKTTDTGQAITFRAKIVNEQDQPVLEVVRTYRLAKDSYELQLDQKLINHSRGALNLAWKQNAQGDLVQSNARYVGDRRQFVTGYFKPDYDNRLRIYADNGYINRRTMVKSQTPSVWPNPNLAQDQGYELAWLAAVNRYFALVTHAQVPSPAQGPPKTANIPPLTNAFSKIRISMVGPSQNLQSPGNKYILITLKTAPTTLDAGKTLDRSLGIFAGPRDANVFSQQPFAALHLDRLIRYVLGCTWFTFQPLAHGLLWFLQLIEGQIISIGGVGIGVHDWGVAIIILVACVRLLLHPITKMSQVSMMKMGKQMQSLQPELEKIKTKYKDDQQKLNAEMMKLYREKGVNPANVLGCAPMMLQTPIWIALYAMLFFAIELRHEPAFYGFFQWISAGHWDFLADLSRSDHFITFLDKPHTVKLILIQFDYSAFNILPLLMGVAFFINQKFTQPPAANEQAAKQQKMMKFMVLLFPLFLYSAPSGLTLYICTSTMAGIFDSYLVRKHVREQEEAGTLFDKKPRKPGGFMDRMHKIMEQKQGELAAKQSDAQKSGGSGKGQGPTQQRRKKSR